MTKAAPPRDNEDQALHALRALDVLDSPPEAEFDALVRAASLVCGTPIALISLIDRDRQWFKANLGLPGVSQTPRDVAFCAHAVRGTGLFEVADATADSRFANNPLVTGEPGIRAYAGVPLRLDSGEQVGTLCVIHRQAHVLDATQRAVLEHLAAAATKALQGRQVHMALAQESQRLASVIEATETGTWEWHVPTDAFRVNDHYARTSGGLGSAGQLPARAADWWQLMHPEDAPRYQATLQQHLSAQPRDTSSDPFICELRVRKDQGRGPWLWVMDRGRVMSWSADGKPLWMFGRRTDITERKAREDAARRNRDFLQRTGSAAGVGGWELDLVTGSLVWSDETRHIHGVPIDFEPVLETAINFYAPEARPVITAAVERAMHSGQGWDLELPLVRADGRAIWARAMGNAEFEDGKPVRLSGAFQDITERKNLALQLAQLNRELTAMLDNDLVGIVKLCNRHSVWKNKALNRIFGYCDDELDNRPARMLYASDEAFERLGRDAYPVLRAGGQFRTQLQMRHKSGELIWIDLSGTLLDAANEESLWMMVDITQMKTHQQHVEQLAYHDALTGLPNRLLLADRLQQALAQAERSGAVLALCFVDLDGFKAVNDEHGHGAGDHLLKEIAGRLQHGLRSNDTVARLGGDEFVLLLSPVAGRHEAQAIAQRLLQRIQVPVQLSPSTSVAVAASVGVALYPVHARRAEQLMVVADQAMFEAKRTGRGRVVFVDDAQDA
jgi:diguanylate cyclase (GGDEF)-like protein/PAS domain S-box-containing protein